MDPMQQLQENQKAAIAIIENAKADIEQVLQGQESVRIGVVAHLTRGANFLHGLTGTAPDNSSQHTFGPMTSFMGEAIQRPEPVADADLKPTDADKEAFRTKRNHLLGALPEMTDDAAFASLKQPQGEALMRNVARIATVPNYDTVAIDVNFLADVRKGLAWIKAEAEAEIVGRNAKADADDLRTEGETKADIPAEAESIVSNQAEASESVKEVDPIRRIQGVPDVTEPARKIEIESFPEVADKRTEATGEETKADKAEAAEKSVSKSKSK